MMVATRLSSPKSRQFIAWYPMQKGNRPVGQGMIGSDRRATIRTPNQPWVRIRPCPTGRIVFAFDETSFLLHRCYQEPSPLSDTFFPFQS
jgi:hypothetical protein